MNHPDRPAAWDDQDVAIAELLNSTPVPGSVRLAAHQSLLNTARARSEEILLQEAQPAEVHPVEVNWENSEVIETVRVAPEKGPWIESRRVWLAVSVVAASLMIGLFWWNATAPLSTHQLVAICADIIADESGWQPLDSQNVDADASELSKVLSKYLKVNPANGIETRPLTSTRVSSEGRLWKLPIPDRNELYVFEFQSPSRIGNLDQHLQVLSGPSSGWSTVAVQTGDRLFVFLSKDDLRRTLRLQPLA